MSSTPVLIPSGTLRHKYNDETSVPKIDRVLSAIAQISAGQYIDPSIVWTAKYLAASEASLDEDAQLGLTLIVFALLVAISEGSTRVPIAPEGVAEDSSFLDETLGRFQSALEEAAMPDENAKKAPPNAAKLYDAAQAIAAIRANNPSALLATQNLPTLLKRVDATMRGEDIPYNPLLLSGMPENPSLTTERMLRKEDALAERFMKRTRESTDVTDAQLEDAIQKLVAHPTYYAPGKAQTPNFEQAHAALLAARAPLAFVTGGPGTGKTSIIVTVLRLLMRLGVAPEDIALAAPTGKAAYRMRESAIAQLNSLDSLADTPAPAEDVALKNNLPESRTLHRLLEYSPGRDIFWRNSDNPVDAKIIICDEASMIDLDMMHALIEASGEDTRLVLVGDADQLPPIGGGQPFRDLIARAPQIDADMKRLIDALNPGAQPTTVALADDIALAAEGPAPGDAMSPFTARLRHSYRMDAQDDGGKAILALARAINTSGAVDSYVNKSVPIDALAEYLQAPSGVARLEKKEPGKPGLDLFVDTWFKQFVTFTDTSPYAALKRTDAGFDDATRHTIQTAFDHHAQARILCLTQVAKTGARAINQALHKKFFKEHATEAEQNLKNRPRFIHLEPVMVTQNNYDLNLFNGDVGLVAMIAQDGKKAVKKVLFPRSGGGFRVVSLNQLRTQLEHAFAMSVHKSQGSEFEHIALVLPLEAMTLLNKPLLYTAVTRASKSVTLVDPAGLFAQGAATDLMRHTGLPERLEAHA